MKPNEQLPDTTIYPAAVSSLSPTAPPLVSPVVKLSQFLLDEEGAEMRQLPSAGHGEDDELDQSPTDDSGVGGFGLIAEFRFSILEGHTSVSSSVQAVYINPWRFSFSFSFPQAKSG